jgi:hypothetical protein
LWLALTAIAASSGSRAHAQIVESALPFLLIPNGARLVGIGSAAVADPSGQDALLANPAGFARPRPREVSLDFATDGVSSRYIATGAVPVRLIGTFAAGIYVDPEASFENTDRNGIVTGQTIIRDVVYSASYATKLTRRLLGGISYKYIQKRYDCTGGCDPSGENPQASIRSRPATTALDLGVQVDPIARLPLTIGAAVRNAGLPFQFKDNEQSDPLPTQVALGASLGIAGIERYLPKSTLRAFVEGTKGVGAQAVQATYHVGGELRYQESVVLRAGYAARNSDYSGAAIGLGFVRRRLTLDIARQLGAQGLLADKPPTYVALRYAF